MLWIVYLFGEIYIDWCEQIIVGVKKLELFIQFSFVVIDYDVSDVVGDVLGVEENVFWCDYKFLKVNVICIQFLIEKVDIVVV